MSMTEINILMFSKIIIIRQNYTHNNMLVSTTICVQRDFFIHGLCSENHPLSQRTPTPYNIKVN